MASWSLPSAQALLLLVWAAWASPQQQVAAASADACLEADGSGCEEVGLLQHLQTKEVKHKKAVASSSLSLFQWNTGHPKDADPGIVGFISDKLEGAAVDFFNVINLYNESFVAPDPYGMLVSNCTKGSGELDTTTLIYQKERWHLVGDVQMLCLSSGKHAAIIANFNSAAGGPVLTVIGAHFGLPNFWDVPNLSKNLGSPGNAVLFLGDTNSLLRSNSWLFSDLDLPVGTDTPTNSATFGYPFFLFRFDRIITTLTGPDWPEKKTEPVDVLDIPDGVTPTNAMHKPISLLFPLQWPPSSAQPTP